MGTLYIVPTPIGNLEDITLRALRILREVRLIAAEDTRTSRVLLDHYQITTPTTSYHEHNKLKKLDAIFDALSSGDVALISDAGTPGISDPGYELVREALARGVAVVPLPGASALIAGLVASGLPTDSFLMLGFLPKKPNARRELFQHLRAAPHTLAAYESPHRLNETLALLIEVMGEARPVCVAREISKMYEEFVRGPASEVLARFERENPRGEVTLFIGAAPQEEIAWDEARVSAALQARIAAGDSLSMAAKAVAAASGWKKSDIYALAVRDEDEEG